MESLPGDGPHRCAAQRREYFAGLKQTQSSLTFNNTPATFMAKAYD